MALSERVFKRNVFRAVVVYTALIAIAWCWLFPIAWAVSGSLKREGEISEPRLLPARPRWSNYTEVFSLMPFWRMFFNTVLYAGCVTAGQVFFCSLAGYAFARFACFVFSGHVDGAADSDGDPAVHPDADGRVIDTPAMIVLGLFGSAGLSDATVLPTPQSTSRKPQFWMVPASTPRPTPRSAGNATSARLTRGDRRHRCRRPPRSLATLTLGLGRLRGEYVARWPIIMATSMLIMLPLVIIYAIAQRSFVRGIAVTGMGG